MKAISVLLLLAFVLLAEARRGVKMGVDPSTGKRTKVVSFGGHRVTDDETSTWVDSPPNVYDYDQLKSLAKDDKPDIDEIQVITNVLTEDELAYYNSLVLNLDTKVFRRIGGAAPIYPDLADRIHSLFHGSNGFTVAGTGEEMADRSLSSSSSCVANEPVAMSSVFQIDAPIPLHEDRYALNDVYTHDFVSVISLQDSDSSYFVWSDDRNDRHYKVPMKRNTMLVFRGNYTHGILTMPDDTVRYLGPFDYKTFVDIGGAACSACSIMCNGDGSTNEVTVTDDADDPMECVYNVKLECPENFVGTICFECDANGFSFFTQSSFLDPATGASCSISQPSLDETKFDTCCGEVKIKVKGKTINDSGSLKVGKGSSKGGIMANVCDLSTIPP